MMPPIRLLCDRHEHNVINLARVFCVEQRELRGEARVAAALAIVYPANAVQEEEDGMRALRMPVPREKDEVLGAVGKCERLGDASDDHAGWWAFCTEGKFYDYEQEDGRDHAACAIGGSDCHRARVDVMTSLENLLMKPHSRQVEASNEELCVS